MKVAICVATYRRPVLLTGLLQSIGDLTLSGTDLEPVVVVTDNDANRSAAAVVDTFRQTFPWQLEYGVEERRNISHARNHAVANAMLHDPDFIAFVDDDAIVDPMWLDELVRVQLRTGADIVSGAVIPKYGDEIPDWIIRGRFLEIPRYATGEPISMAFTGNVLVARKVLENAGPAPFDPKFGISGGGDSFFFMRAHRAGARMVWADEAVAEEIIPPSRARVGWILRRAYRIGNRYIVCERMLHTPWRSLLLCLGKALAAVAGGSLLLVPSIARGRSGVVQVLRWIAGGLGVISGILGFEYREYDMIHGE